MKMQWKVVFSVVILLAVVAMLAADTFAGHCGRRGRRARGGCGGGCASDCGGCGGGGCATGGCATGGCEAGAVYSNGLNDGQNPPPPPGVPGEPTRAIPDSPSNRDLDQQETSIDERMDEARVVPSTQPAEVGATTTYRVTNQTSTPRRARFRLFGR